MAYLCIPSDPAERLAEKKRLVRHLDGLNRWLRRCGRDAEEEAIDRNAEDYSAASARLEALKKAQRRARQ